MFSLKSSHRYSIFNKIKKNILNYPKSAALRFFRGTRERVRNSRGKRAISVRAAEVLLYNAVSKLCTRGSWATEWLQFVKQYLSDVIKANRLVIYEASVWGYYSVPV